MYKKLYKYKKNDTVFLILNYPAILGEKDPMLYTKRIKVQYN
jgi:hypothetical protein